MTLTFKRFGSLQTVFAKGGGHHALKALAPSNYNVIGLDWTIDPREARKIVGDDKVLQVSGVRMEAFQICWWAVDFGRFVCKNFQVKHRDLVSHSEHLKLPLLRILSCTNHSLLTYHC